MKRKKTIATLCALTIIAIVLAIRWFSLTGTYVAWFEGVEPLGGGYCVLVLRPDGTGRVGESPENRRPFTYERTATQLEVRINWDYQQTNTYVFAIAPLRLESLGQRLPDGTLTKKSGYGFMMRGTYYKKPI